MDLEAYFNTEHTPLQGQAARVPGTHSAPPLNVPTSASQAQRALAQRLYERIQSDTRFWGLAIGGSWATDQMDEASDLDFNLVLAPEYFDDVLAEAQSLAQDLCQSAERSERPELFSCRCLCFAPAKHTGASHLFNALYELRDLSLKSAAPTSYLLQVDFKYVSGEDFRQRVEQPQILHEREGRLSQILETTQGAYPRPNLDWLESQFWRWIYYGLAKWRRGEYLEVADHLSFLRNHVLGPLLLWRFGEASRRVRRVEQLLPAEYSESLSATVVRAEPWPLLWGLKTLAELYLETHEVLRPEQRTPGEAQIRVLEKLDAEFRPRSVLYHIARESDWQRAQTQGVYIVESLRSEGFIHLAYAHQVHGVYQRYYQGQTNLWLLHIAPERLRPELREENLYGGQELFPHLYGALALSAVSQALQLTDTQGQIASTAAPWHMLK